MPMIRPISQEVLPSCTQLRHSSWRAVSGSVLSFGARSARLEVSDADCNDVIRTTPIPKERNRVNRNVQDLERLRLNYPEPNIEGLKHLSAPGPQFYFASNAIFLCNSPSGRPIA